MSASTSRLLTLDPPAPCSGGPPTGAARRPRIDLFGIPFDGLSLAETVEQVEESIDHSGHVNISVVNVAKLVNMRGDAMLRESVLTGDLVLADGMPLVWVSRLKRTPLPQRVAGIDLMFELFRLADRRGLRVYLLGAEEAVLDGVVTIAKRDFPGMVLAGYHHGYFRAAEEQDIVEGIRASRADMLFVGMSSPRKEIFMRRWEGEMNVKVIHGVGGSFDVMAGKTRRAPRVLQRMGLEWLYRVIQEPRRMWKRYLLTNTKFMLMAAVEILTPRRRTIERS